jgi:UDP-2,3-diacylglucosamine pyrophosphatase LpxH
MCPQELWPDFPGSGHSWPMDIPPNEVEHVLVVLSDIEMGAGGSTDDFPQSEWLGRLLLAYNRGIYERVPLTLVFNGDTFDMLKTPMSDGTYPLDIDADIAIAKLERIMRAHRPFIDALRCFLDHEPAARRVLFLAGNHDQELLFPEIQKKLAGEIGCPEAISFPGIRVRFGGVQIEHGSQHDPMFVIDEAKLFVQRGGEARLNLPWGTLSLLTAAMPFAKVFHQLDRIRPKDVLFHATPEFLKVLQSAYWQYWTRDYWTARKEGYEALQHITWDMTKQAVLHFQDTNYAAPRFEPAAWFAQHPDVKLLVMGHTHQAQLWTQNDRRYLQTGCFRNEAVYDESGSAQLRPKVYAEVFLGRDEDVVRSRLVELRGPAPEAPFVPASYDALGVEARRLLRDYFADVP